MASSRDRGLDLTGEDKLFNVCSEHIVFSFSETHVGTGEQIVFGGLPEISTRVSRSSVHLRTIG